MAGLHHSVISAFGASKVIREKGYYKTIDGTKMIRKTKDDRGQIMARYQLLDHCNKTGYLWLERYHLSKDELPYVYYDGEYYIMTSLFKHKEADFTVDSEFFKVVKALASFHKAARSVTFSDGAFLHKKSLITPLTEVIQTSSINLDAIRKRIRKQSKMSDFDVLFVKHFSDYRNRVFRALQLLESTGYLKHLTKARQHYHVCHGALKEDCLKIWDDHVYITNLENTKISYQLDDLCDLIRRRERKTPINVATVIDAYSDVLPLKPEEEVILEAMLLYPAAFVKISTEYYRKKRSWTPISMINKMQEVVNNTSSTTSAEPFT